MSLWISNMTVSETFLSLTVSIGVSNIFHVFMVVSISTSVFVILFMPETKGISPEKPEEMLHDLYMEKKKRDEWSSLLRLKKMRLKCAKF